MIPFLELVLGDLAALPLRGGEQRGPRSTRFEQICGRLKPGVCSRQRVRDVDLPAQRLAAGVDPRGIFRRPSRFGAGQPTIWRSKRPGRSSAGSRMSGPGWWPPIKMMLVLHLEPVHLHQELVQSLPRARRGPPPRARAAVPPDGVDLVHEDDAGGVLLGLPRNRSRTRAEAPTPTNISTKSEPGGSRRTGTPASPANPRERSSVLPVPGGPYRSTPLGDSRPQGPWNFFGVL